jgi:hypothetical protein
MPTGACHRTLDPLVGMTLRLSPSVNGDAGWYQSVRRQPAIQQQDLPGDV